MANKDQGWELEKVEARIQEVRSEFSDTDRKDRAVRLAFGEKPSARLRPAKQDDLFDPNPQARMMF